MYEMIQVVEGKVVTCCECDETHELVRAVDPYEAEFASDYGKDVSDLEEFWWCEEHLQAAADAI